MTGRPLTGWYIARLDLGEPHALGVAKKIRAQAASLGVALGPIEIFSPAGASILRGDQVMAAYGSGRLGRRLVHYGAFYTRIAAIADPVDYLYIRYQRASLPLLHMLRRLRRRNPGLVVIVELPSFPYHQEEATLREKLLGHGDRLFRRFLHHDVDRIVTFSRRPSIFGIPTIPTDNGTDVAAVSVLPPPSPDAPIRLLGLANLSFWHGYDRVITGLAAYRQSGGAEQVVFDIIGVGNELVRLQRLASELDVADIVRFHGAQGGAALTACMEVCHVGISSLGLHRLQVETSNLKSREFCARGLPFVAAHADPDFTAVPFVFQAPGDDTPLDIAAVIAFYRQLAAGMPDYPRRMRRFAEQNLGWDAKLAPVVQAIRALCRNGQSSSLAALSS